jgi:hypothetical protein
MPLCHRHNAFSYNKLCGVLFFPKQARRKVTCPLNALTERPAPPCQCILGAIRNPRYFLGLFLHPDGIIAQSCGITIATSFDLLTPYILEA